MTEETHPDDDSYIVRVKAVVMTRDDSSGGWLPQEGGGISRVGVCKVMHPEGNGRSGYLIHGERQKDKLVVLECFVRKDLVYTKANPTFHHWKVDNRKFGLTFQSPADARAFDRGVRKAIEDLIEGSTTSSSTIHNEAELGDDDVFTTATDSSSNSSQKREQPTRALASPPACEQRRIYTLGRIHDQYCPEHYQLEQPIPRPYRHFVPEDDDEIVRINPREKIWMTGYEDYRHAPTRPKFPDASEDVDSYVRFAKGDGSKHDYSYPYVDRSDGERGRDPKGGGGGGAGGAIKTQPGHCKWRRRRKEDGERSRCVYCRDMFNHEENRRGHCQDAPDPVRTCIRRASCMWCADSMLYHCMSDPEGDYTDPCSCDTSDEKFCLRWVALLALSFIAPCMCCYLPLRACYHCGVACGCCGGKHKAAG
ncbi:sprouty-related, EVH1 domain-containing protein 2 isoform X1 [Ornithorhynchus anatinus]|uniref:Sprouty-related, EVH1 domain-containing protein 2 n=1 Tax=Ornithorhynchus anatinus TaxID=9258 RepID=A0A6I8NXW4_ORNAN|nr:sprouty-related, EVH1 domain-containing protein 2 isoform X1 [Ornithorhynchus anatinus]